MKTPSAVAASHLPATVDRFIGRERELQAIASLFNQPHVRLVTLTGTGGSGKTRLALQAAARLDGAFEVVCFVPLASVQDPAHVASTLARVLDVEDSGAQPTVEALQHFLRNRQVLLVLDNFEHVAAAAPVVADLLRSCPCLQVLVTSRESLRLSGEHEFPVLPLQLPDAMAPDPATIGRVESVALFVQRSRAVNPNFILTKENARDVAEICVRLEGLPLSIELAAARSKVLPPKTLLARLSSRLAFLTGGARDLPDRQRTLRNTLDWSYALLGPNEQVLFARLAVFVGGASLGAVEAVCGGAFAVLESLVAKSLVRQEQPALAEPRVMLLETVREYALEHLTDSGELEAMRRQHATYFLSLALQAEPELRGPQQAEWVRRLEDEHSNIQASLRWWLRCAREDGTVAEQCLRLAGALWRFWWVRGHVSLGRAQLVEVLALPAPIEHTEAYVAARAEATFGAGVLSVVAGDHAGSRTLFHESLALWQQLGDEAGVAYVLQNLGEIEMDLGAYASAYALLTRSVSTFRRIDDQQGLAWPLSALGFVALEQHDFTTAYDALQESLVIFRDRGEQMGVAQTLHFLALFHEDQEHHALAWDLFRQSLEIRHDVGDRPGTVLTLEGIAGLAAAYGQTQLAALLAGATAAWRSVLGARIFPALQMSLERRLRAARQEGSAFTASWDQGQHLTLDEAVAKALQLVEQMQMTNGTGDALDTHRPKRSLQPPQAAHPWSAPGEDWQVNRLTPRQREVAILISQGLTNREIAERLVISPGTAGVHVEHILSRLELRSRSQIAAWVIEHGLLTSI